MSLVDHVDDFLKRHQLAKTTGVVAVSGGPDSVALAHLLVDLLRNDRLERLIVAHLNHQLRGNESDADEAFVQNLFPWDARQSSVTTRIDVARIAHAERANLESVARRERYAWLTQVARMEHAAWIATGHTADDQAETVLFRLLRGSGVRGLSGMAECRALEAGIVVARPLLSIRRQSLLDYLHQKQITHRVDSSNEDRRFTRNRLRHELMPVLEQYNPIVVDIFCRLAAQARALHDDIAARAKKLLAEAELPRAGNVVVFAAERCLKADANDVREMFRAVWEREGWPMADMDFERWNRLAAIAAGTLAAFDFPGKISVRRVGRVLQLERKAAQSS
jgi:tRNA(Ile)-lysidine synthase